MSSLFSKPKVPTPVAAPPAPTVDDARMKSDEADRTRLRKGRASTNMVQAEGGVSTAARVLTGN